MAFSFHGINDTGNVVGRGGADFLCRALASITQLKIIIRKFAKAQL